MRSVTPILKNALTTPWIVFALSFAVRLAIVSGGYHSDPQDTPEYDEIARNLLSGNGFVVSDWWYGHKLWSWRAPFYPFFLAGVYGIFGYNHLVVRVIQCLVGALTAVLVMRLAQKLNRASAPICSGLAIVYGPLAAISNQVMTEAWFAFFLVLSVYWLTPPIGVHAILGAGVALGLAALTRPVGLVLLPALVGVTLVEKRHYRHLVLTLGTTLLVLLPWTLRNYAIHGVWPMLSSQGGFIVARSNALYPDWRKPKGWGVTPELLSAMPSEVARDRFWRAQARAFVQNHPGVYLRLAGERFLRFWYFFHPYYNAWFMAVLPFFVLGICWFWRQSGYLLLTLLIGLSVLVFSFVLYGTSRFRLPLEPFFLIFAGAAVESVAQRLGSGRTLGLVGGVAVIHVLIAWQAEFLRTALLDLLFLWGIK